MVTTLAEAGGQGQYPWRRRHCLHQWSRVAAVAAVAVAAVVEEEEEEEEGAMDRNGDRVVDSNGVPITHGDQKDGNRSAAPCTGRMTMTTAATATGGEQDRPM